MFLLRFVIPEGEIFGTWRGKQWYLKNRYGKTILL